MRHKKTKSEYIEPRAPFAISMRKIFGSYEVDERLDDLLKYIMKYGKLDITKSDNEDVAIKIDGIYLFIHYFKLPGFNYNSNYRSENFCSYCYAYKKYEYRGTYYDEKVWGSVLPSRKVCVDFQRWINERIEKAKRLGFYPNDKGMLYD